MKQTTKKFKFTPSNAILAISVALNLVLLFVLGLAKFTNTFDYVMLNHSIDRMCDQDFRKHYFSSIDADSGWVDKERSKEFFSRSVCGVDLKTGKPINILKAPIDTE